MKVEKMKKIYIFIIFCALTGIFFWLLVLDKFLSTVEFGLGSNYLESPNGRYEAYFHSFSTMGLFAIVGLSDFKRFYRFEIYDVKDKPKGKPGRYTDENRVKRVDLDVLHREFNIELNYNSEYIEWSADSSEVTYAFKDIEFKLKIDEPKDERKE